MTKVIAWAVDPFVRVAVYIIELSALFYESLRSLFTIQGRKVVLEATERQILFTGVEALPVMGLMAFILGAVVILQALTQLPKLGAEEAIGTVLVMVIIREVGPLMTALMVVGRSGSAIAIELGNMQVHEEITAIEAMGINTMHFLTAPRIIGVVLSMVCLFLYFDLVALAGGFLVARWTLSIPIGRLLHSFAVGVQFADLIVGIVKCTLNGIAISLICIYQGLEVKGSPTEVPQAATKAIVRSFIVCMVLNIFVTYLFYR